MEAEDEEKTAPSSIKRKSHEAVNILFESAEAGLLARAVKARASSLLVVVFSQARVPAGHFGLSRLFARTPHACLFLNQPENLWYRGQEAAIDRAIARALALSGASGLVLYGSSMGAFGALRTAPRWPEARVYAYVPDLLLGETGSASARAGLDLDETSSWMDRLEEPREGLITLVMGVFDPYGAGVLASVAARAHSCIHLVPILSAHEVHDHLYRVNVIRRLIGGFSRTITVEAGSRGLLLPSPPLQALATLARIACDFEEGKPADPAEVLALGLDDNPGAALLAARIHARRGAFREAVSVLAAMGERIEASPVLGTLPHRYLKILARHEEHYAASIRQRNDARGALQPRSALARRFAAR